ncbi:MAG: mechanosensitive ion channel family protein [Synergistaceae bacterium]|nr:mechanosensitive ion channel family protein [Synergistaceae bacterium]
MDSLLNKIQIDWLDAVMFLAGPLAVILAWFVIDRLLIKLHKKSKFVERIFTTGAYEEAQKVVIAQRVKTFRGLFVQSVRALNGIFFLLMFLGRFRVDLKPLLAGIGVVGLGLSLAAQNILRDFINGLLILIEDQFNVGDWISIGSFSGTVERFTMRATSLRATDGRLIVIPNGTISQVANSTKKFSVALVEVGVDYATDIQKALAVLESCAKDATESFRRDVIGQPTVQGIVSFGASDLQLRVLIKTVPGAQWAVERALRVKIKEAFEREGISIPFPQLVVHREADA